MTLEEVLAQEYPPEKYPIGHRWGINAFSRGWRDAEKGVSRSQCPYSRGRRRWLAGYNKYIAVRSLESAVRTSVNKCSACGSDHEDLVFNRLSVPVELNGRHDWTHQATCPFNGMSILMRFVDENEET